MHTITRNTKNNKKGKHLLFPFGGHIYVSVKNAKTLCGYSETTSNDVIWSKVSTENIKFNLMFSKKGNIIENYFLTTDGFIELVSKLTQKDKKQNGELAIKMIEEAYAELREYVSEPTLEEVKADKFYSTEYRTEMAEKIREEMSKGSFDKDKWTKLYSKCSAVNKLEENIMKSARRHYGEYCTLKYQMLNYVASERPELLESLYEIAQTL